MRLESNIRKYYAFMFFRNINIILPIMVIYFMSKGLGLLQANIVLAVMWISWGLFEIPAGMFSDRFSRKSSLMLSVFLSIIGLAAAYLAQGFYTLIFASILFGMANSFLSGINTAFAYDTMLALGRKDEYRKIEGNAFALNMVAMALGAALCSFLTSYSLSLPFLAMIPANLMALFFVFSFKEPEREKSGGISFIERFIDGARYTVSKKNILKLIAYYSALYMLLNVSFMHLQPYFKSIGIAEVHFGLIYLILLIMTSLSSRYAYAIENRLGQHMSLVALPAFAAMFMLAYGFFPSKPIILFAMFGEVAYGMLVPIFSDHLNSHISSERRSTILSINSMMGLLISSLFALIFGKLSETYGILTEFRILGFLAVIAAIVSYLGFKGYRKG